MTKLRRKKVRVQDGFRHQSAFGTFPQHERNLVYSPPSTAQKARTVRHQPLRPCTCISHAVAVTMYLLGTIFSTLCRHILRNVTIQL